MVPFCTCTAEEKRVQEIVIHRTPNKCKDPYGTLLPLPSCSSLPVQIPDATMMKNPLCYVEDTVVQPHQYPCQVNFPSVCFIP